MIGGSELELRKARIRQNLIKTAENIVITEDEYNNLPPDQYGFEWINFEVDQETGKKLYRKQTKTTITEQRLNEIILTRGIRILNEEYIKLPDQIKDGFEWIKESDGPYHSETGYLIKGRSNEEIQNHNEDRLNEIRYTPGIIIDYSEYRNLPEEIKEEFQWTDNNPYSLRHILIGMMKGKSIDEIEKDKRQFINEIIFSPNKILREDQYINLPDEIKTGFTWRKQVTYGDIRDHTNSLTEYIKQTSPEDARANRVNEIIHTPNIVITLTEWRSLPENIKSNFEWINYRGDYQKGLSIDEIQINKQKRLNQIKYERNIKILNGEYENLKHDTQGKIIINSFEWRDEISEWGSKTGYKIKGNTKI